MENSYVLQLQEPKFKEFYLSYSGYAQCEPLHCYGPASRPHYLIHFVLKGKGRYQAAGQTHCLTAGQGFLIEPGTQTFYQADKERIHGVTCGLELGELMPVNISVISD